MIHYDVTVVDVTVCIRRMLSHRNFPITSQNPVRALYHTLRQHTCNLFSPVSFYNTVYVSFSKYWSFFGFPANFLFSDFKFLVKWTHCSEQGVVLFFFISIDRSYWAFLLCCFSNDWTPHLHFFLFVILQDDDDEDDADDNDEDDEDDISILVDP